MRAADFCNHLYAADRNRELMARVLLNAVLDRAEFPVDLSELRQLSAANRVATEAFLQWRRWNRSASFPCSNDLIEIARG